MLFDSLAFLVFFPVVVILYFSLKQEHRWILLLIVSYYFYMSWRAEYILLIIISTLVNYVAGMQIHASRTRSRKRWFLLMSLIVNLGLLFTFKYWNFFSGALRDLLAQFAIPFNPVTLNILLPIGISFYTFQTLSYSIDVYNGKIRPERHLGIFATYVSFFPLVLAGPIERAKNLIPQFTEDHKFEYEQVTDGLQQMLWGFFKKMVIADKLALVVNTVYNNPASYTGLPLILATVLFAVQLYCDFSGYTDIAIGAARVMGIRLMQNFNHPYFSKSISEFWRRWHISLSSWFRDYLYIPLGGNRVAVPRWYLNLFIVFLVCGLWHGANWTFIVWGALHGFYLVFALISKGLRERAARLTRISQMPWLHDALKIAITFALVNIGWIFFRANTLGEARYILTHLFTGLDQGISDLGLGVFGLLYFLTLIIVLEFIDLIQEHEGMRRFFSARPAWFRWSAYLILIVWILLFGVFEKTTFIYFQF
jgi:alginate O-acetyltransferase complex protein AlgI